MIYLHRELLFFDLLSHLICFYSVHFEDKARRSIICEEEQEEDDDNEEEDEEEEEEEGAQEEIKGWVR